MTKKLLTLLMIFFTLGIFSIVKSQELAKIGLVIHVIHYSDSTGGVSLDTVFAGNFKLMPDYN